MKVSFYSTNKLREFIRIKDPLSRNKKSNVIYKISCKSCDANYVRQTCRQLKSRITEHKNHIRWNTSVRNVITEHWLQEDHDFVWDNTGASLQEEIDFEDDIHQETDAWTQPTNRYGGASQGLPLDYRYEGLNCCLISHSYVVINLSDVFTFQFSYSWNWLTL